MKITLQSIILFLSLAAPAQQTFEWGLQAGSTGNDQVTGIATVKNDIFVTGSFTGELLCNKKSAVGYGAYDLFLMKTGADGNPEWIRSLGGEKADYGNCLTADEEQVCVAGLIYGTVKFEKQTFEGDGPAIAISSFNLDGKLNWLARLPYTGIATTDVVQLLPNGSVLAGGMFQGTVETDAGELKSPNRRLAWQALFSAEGKLEKITPSSGLGSHGLKAASVDGEGNLYLLYQVTGSMDVEDGTRLQVSRGTKSALILQKIDSNSHFLWGRVFEGTGYFEEAGIAAGKNRDVLLCMNFSKELRTPDTLLTCNSQLQTALVSLREDGKTNWTRTVSSRVNSRALDVLADQTGNALVTGAFREDFSTGDLTFESGESNSNLFLLRFNPEGKMVWYDAPAQDATNVCTAFALDETGNIVLAGLFRDELNLNGESMPTFGKKDIFLAKYFNCDQMEVQISGGEPLCKGGSRLLSATQYNRSAANGFETYIWNGAEPGTRDYEIFEPGTYWVTAYTQQGCAASDTVEVIPVEMLGLGLVPEITLGQGDEKTVAAGEGFVSYVWSDGEQGRQREVRYEEGPASRLLVLSAQTKDGCEVSDTLIVRFNKVPDNGLSIRGQGLKIYPNPVTDYLWWSMDMAVEGTVEIRLADSKSTTVHLEEIQNCHAGEPHSISMKGVAAGNYLLTVKAGDTVFNEKVIKK